MREWLNRVADRESKGLNLRTAVPGITGPTIHLYIMAIYPRQFADGIIWNAGNHKPRGIRCFAFLLCPSMRIKANRICTEYAQHIGVRRDYLEDGREHLPIQT